VLEDFVASSPHPRANTIFERAFPFAFQQSKAFVGVNLLVQMKNNQEIVHQPMNYEMSFDYDGSNGADDLDRVASLGRVETRLFKQKLGSWQSNVGELSVDPTASFRAVVSAYKDLASLVHEILPAKLLVVQVNWVVCYMLWSKIIKILIKRFSHKTVSKRTTHLGRRG
jgi:hypothetical protein